MHDSFGARARVDQPGAHGDGRSRQSGAARGAGMARNNAVWDWLSITRYGFLLFSTPGRSMV